MEKALDYIKPDNRVRNGYGVAFCLLLLSFFVILFSNQQLKKQIYWIQHSYHVAMNLEALLSIVKDAETAVRGYVITKDEAFLKPYEHVHRKLDSISANLDSLTVDNAVQYGNFQKVRLVLAHRMEITDTSVYILQRNGVVLTPYLISLQPAARSTMENLRAKVADMQIHEQALMKMRQQAQESNASFMEWVIFGAVFVSLGLLVFGFFIYRSSNKSRIAAISRIKEVQDELQHRVTELADANEKLEQMKRVEKFAATGRIARTIAHEIRNPLMNINLAVEEVKGALLEPDQHGMLQLIRRNSDRINTLITTLLESTKFAELQQQKVDVNEVLEDALSLASDRIALQKISVRKKFDASLCHVCADQEKLKIAFLNIIINAIEAMEATSGDRILTLQTRHEKKRCIVIISDSGPGMDDEIKNRLFDPYFTTKSSGNGLGLTNTQGIILSHKGDISVQSTKGQGTTFIVQLNFAT